MEGISEFQKSPKRQLKPEYQGVELAEGDWLRGLRDRFNRVFSKDQKGEEPFPKVAIEILYAPHSEPEDLAGLKNRIKDSDIVIPELANWTQSILEISNKVSFGKLSPEEAFDELKVANDPYWIEFYKIIHNSSKPVVFIDTSTSSPLYKEINRNIKFSLKGDFKGFIKGAFKKSLVHEAKGYKKREALMVSQVDDRIKEVLKEYPLLKQKDSLNVLLSLGSVHTPVYFMLRKMGKNVTREFNILPTLFSFRDETVRGYRFDKKVDDELLARAFIDVVFSQPLIELLIYKTKRNFDLNKRHAFVRKIISQFNPKDARELFDSLKEGRLEAQGMEKVNKLFVGKLLEKGILIPQSNQELDQFLAKPLPRPDTMRE